MTRALIVAALVAGCAHAPAVAHSHSLVGQWGGTWTRDGDPLDVTVRFAQAPKEHAVSGTFDADALQVARIPLGDVRVDRDRVQWKLVGDDSTATFDLALAPNGDTLTGTFVDGTTTGQVALHRVTPAEDRFKTYERDVRFRDGDVTLAGTIVEPDTHADHGGFASFPAVVFVHGSGPESRAANRYLAQRFAEAGYASLIYDKRGVGESTGDWQGVGIAPLVDDALAAVAFLRSQPEIRAGEIGIYGHSQGGEIVPTVAARFGLAFAIASSAPGLPPDQVEDYSFGNSLGVRTLPEPDRSDARAYAAAVVDVAYRGGDRAKLDELAAKLHDRAWFSPVPPPDAPYWAFSRALAGFDPAAEWSRVKSPVVLIYGELDERVPVAPSIEAIKRALANSDHRVDVTIVPGVDHNYALAAPGKRGWPKHVPTYAQQLLDGIQRAARRFI